MNKEKNDKMVEAKRKWKFAPLAWALPTIGPGISGLLWILFGLFIGAGTIINWLFIILTIISFIIGFIVTILCFIYSGKYEKTIRHGLGGLIVLQFYIVGYLYRFIYKP